MLNLREISDDYWRQDAMKREEELFAKKEQDKKDYENWLKSREEIVTVRVEELISELVNEAKAGKIEYLLQLDYTTNHQYGNLKDPVYNAYVKFANDNKINFKLVDYPRYETDYDGRETNYILCFEQYLKFTW